MSSKIRTVLIDLSGTIHVEDDAIPGAVQAIRKLRSAGLNVKFATNTTKESRRLLCERLGRIGFQIQEQDIFTSLTAARVYVVHRKLKPYLLVDDAALEDFENYFPTDIGPEEADAVLVGLAPQRFDYDHMNAALRILHRPSSLIAIHKARYFKTQSSLSLGPGLFVSALEFATDRQAIVVGKPNPHFFLQSIREFGSAPEECVMVGDDVRDDVLGAQAVGFRGILVQTGKYRTGDENGVTDLETGERKKPDLVCPTIAEAVEVIIKETL